MFFRHAEKFKLFVSFFRHGNTKRNGSPSVANGECPRWGEPSQASRFGASSNDLERIFREIAGEKLVPDFVSAGGGLHMPLFKLA